MIGTALCESLAAGGHDVVRIVRRSTARPDEVAWDPEKGILDPSGLQGIDAVVNLAGANVGEKRWTPAYKRVIKSSRINSTQTLAKAIAQVDPPPRVLVSASGISYYGVERGDLILDETASPGPGFLSEVVQVWEQATHPAQAAGIRVCHARTGLVMTRRGGAFARMLPFFRLGAGGRLGSGRQYWSFVSLRDVVRAIQFLLEAEGASGSYNVTAPQPVTNAEFTRVLSRVLRRPAVIPVPAWALRIVVGEFAQDVLGSLRVVPTRLLEAGFTHVHPDAESTIRAALVNGSPEQP